MQEQVVMIAGRSAKAAEEHLDQIGHAEIVLARVLWREGQPDLLGPKRRECEAMRRHGERLTSGRRLKLDEGRHSGFALELHTMHHD